MADCKNISNRIDALQEPQTGISRYRRVHQVPGVLGDVLAECVLATGRRRQHRLQRRRRRKRPTVRENDLLVQVPVHRRIRGRDCSRKHTTFIMNKK